MSRYVLRYFVDPGAGICLWSANDAAREKFGYPVQINNLGLSEDVVRKAISVMAWHDTSLDWSHPVGPSPWSEEERARFFEASQSLLAMLQQQLGPEF